MSKKINPPKNIQILPLNIDEDEVDQELIEEEETEVESEYEPEIDEDEIEESDDESEHYISKAKVNSCIKNNYCSKCDGTPHDPEEFCRCVCHDLT